LSCSKRLGISIGSSTLKISIGPAKPKEKSLLRISTWWKIPWQQREWERVVRAEKPYRARRLHSLSERDFKKIWKSPAYQGAVPGKASEKFFT